MSKKFKVPTLDETQKQLEELLDLTAKFTKFEIPGNLRDEGHLALKYVAEGREEKAVETIEKVMVGIRNLLSGYLRKSPLYFARLRSQLDARLVLDKDIAKRLDKVLEEYKLHAQYGVGIDLFRDQEKYFSALEALSSVETEQKARNEERRKRREEERREADAREAEEHKAREEKRRSERAENFERILSRM